MAEPYVPEAGDIVWLQFDPQAGREQRGARPAIVISPSTYNDWGMMICAPITNQVKGYPFEVMLSGGVVTGVVLSDQVKSVDWRARRADFRGKALPAELAQVRAKILPLITGK